jgi:hypothetical protein
VVETGIEMAESFLQRLERDGFEIFQSRAVISVMPISQLTATTILMRRSSGGTHSSAVRPEVRSVVNQRG